MYIGVRQMRNKIKDPSETFLWLNKTPVPRVPWSPVTVTGVRNAHVQWRIGTRARTGRCDGCTEGIAWWSDPYAGRLKAVRGGPRGSEEVVGGLWAALTGHFIKVLKTLIP